MGMFLTLGGGYALLRELLWMDMFREGWAAASVLLVLVGATMLAFGTDIFRLQDAFFSMTPKRIVYRVSVLGRQQEINWEEVSALDITESLVTFVLVSGRQRYLRLGAIQQPEIARHVSRSLHLAAIEKGLVLNGIKASSFKPALQA
ncbi:hypothetical protein GCM10007389_31760 [Pontibacter akesuensis]|nr:hypothetical protein GCM10007389_31760 [Pontibacter akesuensis]